MDSDEDGQGLDDKLGTLIGQWLRIDLFTSGKHIRSLEETGNDAGEALNDFLFGE